MKGVEGGTVRAPAPGWPCRAPASALNQDSSQPSTAQGMKQAQAALLRREKLGLVAGDAAPPPLDRGWAQCWGQQQLYWVTFISLSVCPSEPEEPTDPGPACHPWFPDLCTDQ